MAFTGDWLERAAQLGPDRVALYDARAGLRPITYGEWNATANRTARWLRQRGVRAGDRVAVLSHNRVEVLDLWFACGKLGAIFQPLNWRLSAGELAAVLADTTPALVVVEEPPFGPSTALGMNGVALDRLRERDALSPEGLPAARLRADTPWVLCSTGGSTGAPKCAVLTHGSIGANAESTAATWGLRPDDVALLNAPLFHTGGLNVFTSPLVSIGGASVVSRGFDCDEVFDLVERRAISLLFGVPTMFLGLQEHPRWASSDFSPLRLVISGGAPCPLPVFQRFFERGVAFRTGYGLTEAGPNNFWLGDEEVRAKPGAVGRPLRGVSVRIVDEQGRDCADEQVGELWIRGQHLCAGYWRRERETAEAFRDGWLRTGDLARRDPGGCHWIAGRSKDLIISGGENVYPAEVESVLAGHPGVGEVVVIGVADARWGEVPRAVIAARGARPSEAELLEHCRAALARYKVPRSIVFVDALPRTGAGKLDRTRIRREHGSAA